MKSFDEYIEDKNIKKFTMDNLVNYVRDYFFELKDEYDKEIDDYITSNNLNNDIVDMLYNIYNINSLIEDYQKLLKIRKKEKKSYKRNKRYFKKQLDAAAFMEFKSKIKYEDLPWSFDRTVDGLYGKIDNLEQKLDEEKKEIKFLKEMLNDKKSKLSKYEERLMEVYNLSLDDVSNNLDAIYMINKKYFEKFNSISYDSYFFENYYSSIVKSRFAINFLWNLNCSMDEYYNQNRDICYDYNLFNLDVINDRFDLVFGNNNRRIRVDNVFKNYNIKHSYKDKYFYRIVDNKLIEKFNFLELIKKEIEYDKSNQKSIFITDYSSDYDYRNSEWENSSINNESRITVSNFLDLYYKEIEKIQYLYRNEIAYNLDFVGRDLFQIFDNIEYNNKKVNLYSIEVFTLDDYYESVGNEELRNNHINKILELEDALVYRVEYDDNEIDLTVDLDSNEVYVTFRDYDETLEFIINSNKNKIIKDFEETINLDEDKKIEIINNIKNKYKNFLSLHSSIKLDNGKDLRVYMSDQYKLGNYVFDGYDWNRDKLTIEVWDNDELLDRDNTNSMNDIFLKYLISSSVVNRFIDEFSNCYQEDITEEELNWLKKLQDRSKLFEIKLLEEKKLKEKEKAYIEIYNMLDEVKKKEDIYREMYGDNVNITEKVRVTNEFLFDDNRQIRKELLDKLDYLDFSDIDFEGSDVSEELLDKIKPKSEKKEEDDFVKEYYKRKKIMMKKRG